MTRLLVVLALGLVAACDGDLDPPWQLDHDRIIAVRATPPAIMTGERSDIDGLVSAQGGLTTQAPPAGAAVVSPEVLAAALTFDAGRWVVTGPSEEQLVSARAELKLEPGAPVPLQIGVLYPGDLYALKTVWLAMTGANPELSMIAMDGAPPPEGEIVVGKEIDVPLSIEALETDEVNWLTSCGTMHDFDLPEAYLRVEPEDPVMGELVVVRRDDRGGVTWRVWPIRAE